MDAKTFVTVYELSRRLGLPVAWLKSEAEARRIPSLRTRSRIMFNTQDVERVLMDRARKAKGGNNAR